MAISSPWPDAYVAGTIAVRLRRASVPVWMLALQTDAFARLAWHDSPEAARALERTVTERFVATAHESLREDDAAVHAPGSDRYAIVLFGPARDENGANAPDRHRALAGIERRFREALGVDAVSNWRLLLPGDDLATAVDEALDAARRRRERREYATLLHDIATPIAAIASAVAGVVDKRFDQRTSERFLSTALSEAARVGRMMREFIAAERTETGVATDAVRALDNAMAAVAPLAAARGIAMRTCSRSASVPVALDLHEDAVVSLLVNLFENAIKHGRENGTVKSRLRALGASCEIEIDDDGPGVAEGDRERIFEFGERGRATTDGSGIGLAQARGFVEAHGGEICVQRSPMGGARFTVRLPLDGRANGARHAPALGS